jgi:hypothetical protein
MKLKVEMEEEGNLVERYSNHINNVVEATIRNTHLLQVQPP